ALLGTRELGAGYYQHVDRGRAQRALEREIQRLRGQIETGSEQHEMLRKIRHDAAVGVTEVSDLLGGADFPAESIWDQPDELVRRARDFNIGGNVKASQAYLVVAAIATRNAARLLADYVNDTGAGAE